MQKLISEEGVVYAMGEIDEPMENKDVFSSSVEVKILTKGMPSLAKLCGMYSPFSIEVLRPDEVRMTVDQAHALLMDIAVNNYELKKLIIEKVYKPEDLAVFKRAMEGRLEVGKRLLEKKR